MNYGRQHVDFNAYILHLCRYLGIYHHYYHHYTNVISRSQHKISTALVLSAEGEKIESIRIFINIIVDFKIKQCIFVVLYTFSV